MGNPAFNVIVVLFWLATMSWLVVAKIVPPLRVGEPPSYTTILADSEDEPPACWTIRMQDRTIGWAANKLVLRKEGISEFYSRVYLAQLPLDELAPGWLTSVLKPVFPNLDLMDVDKQSWFIIDSLGRLSEFESRVRLADIPDAIRVQGTVEKSRLKLLVKSGDVGATLYQALTPNSTMNDELSPQARLPNLRVGQTWTVPLYSPFRSPHSPLEILQAAVEREDPLNWNGETIRARVVVYRNDSGSGRSSDEIRGRTWIRDDGMVLRQEVSVFKSPVQFERLPDAQARELWQALPENWRQSLPPQMGARLLGALLEEPASEIDDADAETSEEP